MTACQLCGHDLALAVTVGTTARHGEAMHSVACARCGLVQAATVPSDAELAAYYAGPYRAAFTREPVGGHEWGSPEAEALLDEAAAEYAGEIVAALGLGPESLVLEVGCGDGRLTHALGRHTVAAAIEADPAMAAEAERRGVEARAWTLREAVARDSVAGEYDGLVCCHVLEHFADVPQALADMRAMLRPGGRVWLEVPNVEAPYNDLDAHYWQRPHLVCFSATTLALALNRAGFEGVQVATQGHVLLAVATNGYAGARSYNEACTHFRAVTGAVVPTGAEVAAELDAYRERWRRHVRRERAVEVLRAVRDGTMAVPAEVVEAIEYLGSESARAATIAQMAVQDACGMVGVLDAEVSAAERHSADPWLLGFDAGSAAMAARASHMVGHAVNRWKLLEVGE
jgi:2-polyprenyl-3-methyl-5-hydroxy-6-metoxy-1,4-benzoquinol methylase